LPGRQGLGEALEQRFRPYTYESTRPLLRWLFLALLLFIAVAVLALVNDLKLRNAVDGWRNEGLTAIPLPEEDVARALIVAPLDVSSQVCAEEMNEQSIIGDSCRSMTRVFEFAAESGLDCSTNQQLASITESAGVIAADCERLIDVSSEFGSLNDWSSIATYGLVVALIIAAFPFSSFTHRSSRNLPTLKSEGQRVSPDRAVLWFFVPLINLYKPWQVFIELFRGSDPLIPHRGTDTTLWKKRGRISPAVFVWAGLWSTMLVFNPITVPRGWYRVREDLADVSSTATALTIANVVLIALGVAAILMANTLSKWQDRRRTLVGEITVVPPRPVDPLERLLSEGVRRSDTEAERARDQRSK
jgi:hypothetical protein